MNCAVLIQTCDKYEKFWNGFFNFFDKHWDFNIDSKIYFSNENKEFQVPKGIVQIKTGYGTFVENLNKSIKSIEEENVFFLLEDFWPIAPMRKDLFLEFYNFFIENNLDSFQIGPYTPYYNLEKMGVIRNRDVWKIKSDSDWLFNFQARFWKKNTLQKCIVEPNISEETVGSAITVEMSSNQIAKREKINVAFFHYFWYPIGGVAHRGNFTEIGKQMENIVNIDEMTKKLTN